MMDYLTQNLWLTWLLVGLACLILEMMDGDFYIMCFAIGSSCVSFVPALTDSIVVHMIVFAILSVLSVFLVRPVAPKYFRQGADSGLSNADALIGRGGKITDTIEAGGYDRVKVNGDSWKAQPAGGMEVDSGAVVRILRFDSIIAAVECC